MRKYAISLIILCVSIVVGYSQTPNLDEFYDLLFKSSFDSVESILIKRGYWFQKSENIAEGDKKHSVFYFKGSDAVINAQEQIIIFKEKENKLNPFFDRIIFGGYSAAKFYDLKNQLPSNMKSGDPIQVGKCLKRNYSNEWFISYQFSICSSESSLTQYMVMLYFSF